MTQEKAKTLARHARVPVIVGTFIAMVLTLSYVTWDQYRSPTELDGSSKRVTLSDLPPFIDGPWIKVPFDRTRLKECLTQSTFDLVRETDYPEPLGTREDDVAVELRNNPISGIGTSHKLLWLKRPDVPAGAWMVTVSAGRDCGGWFHPGTSESGPITIGQVLLPGAK